jgi:hypothetical protein
MYWDAIGAEKGKKGCCCCCAEDITLANEKPHYWPNRNWIEKVGNEFDVVVDLNYRPSSSEGAGECTLEWWEGTDYPFVGPDDPWTRYRMVNVVPWCEARQGGPGACVTLENWFSQPRQCPGLTQIVLHDKPSYSVKDESNRPLTIRIESFFYIVVHSAPGCDCAASSVALRFKQIVVLDGGKPVRPPVIDPYTPAPPPGGRPVRLPQ